MYSTQYCGRHDSSVGIVTRLQAQEPRSWDSIPGTSEKYLLQSAKISPKAHLVFCSISIGGSFSGVKRPGCEAIHSHPVIRLRMSGAVPLFPYTWCIQGSIYFHVCLIVRYFALNFIVEGYFHFKLRRALLVVQRLVPPPLPGKFWYNVDSM